MATVEIQDLCKVYGDHSVLQNLNVEVGEGEFLTLLGPSGCGKTTTLRCVAGLERADGGRIRIGGRLVASAAEEVFVPPNKRDIGMVFQSYALWPHMTVFANVAYPLKMRRTAGAAGRQRVMEILETVGMDRFAQRHVTELSGGQQQRVALARAMVARPGLLLFDEPLSNLDAKLRRTMRREIRAAHDASGGSSIYVTHDQEEAITLSDRVVVLQGGVVQQIGTPRDIYREPANAFVADFVGFDNLLSVTVTRSTGDGCAVALAGVSGSVWAQRGAAPRVGSQARLAVRAEHVLIEPLSHAGAEALTGTVRTCTYTGQHVEYVVEVGDQKVLARVDEETGAAAPFASGDQVAVRPEPSHAVLVRTDGADVPAARADSSQDVAGQLEEVR